MPSIGLAATGHKKWGMAEQGVEKEARHAYSHPSPRAQRPRLGTGC